MLNSLHSGNRLRVEFFKKLQRKIEIPKSASIAAKKL